MFHIVRHLSHKSIICQNKRSFPSRNNPISQDDVKSTLETDGDQEGQMDMFSLQINAFRTSP